MCSLVMAGILRGISVFILQDYKLFTSVRPVLINRLIL